MSEVLQPKSPEEQLNDLTERKWDLTDELGAVNLAIAALKNVMMGRKTGEEGQNVS